MQGPLAFPGPVTRILARRVLHTTWARRLAFRWLVVSCQAATVLLTWPLWSNRVTPPPLPLVPSLPAVDTGWPLLATLALVLVRPRLGMALHVLVLLYAVAVDQTRLQPEVVSLALLLAATLPGRWPPVVGRAHLISLWLWAGVNKLLSPVFRDDIGGWMLRGAWPDAPDGVARLFAYVVIAGEIGVGVLALVPRTRRLAALAALLLHAGILIMLSPLGRGWNSAVWPWNVALACAGFVLIAPWRESPRRAFVAARGRVRALVLVLLLAPAGFYVGLTDAYLAHNLYSGNAPFAFVCNAAGACVADPAAVQTLARLNVPLPPEPRLIRASFRRTCRTGDRLVLTDPRWWARARGQGQQILTCPLAT